MSLEQSIQNLADAINALAKVARAPVTETAGEDGPKRGPGRPRKESSEPAAPVASPAPVAVEAPTAAPVSAGPVAVVGSSPAPAVSKTDVQQALVAVVQTLGKAACTELCKKYGAPNLSAISEAHYGALLADAKSALAAAAEV